MKRTNLNLGTLFIWIGGVTYPFIIYFFMDILPAWTLLLLGACFLSLNFYKLHGKIKRIYIVMMLAAITVLLVFLGSENARSAVKIYPVIVSLSVAAYFGFSLLYPPTAIERIARLTTPDLSLEGILYTKRVTWVWLGFLLFNAGISLGVALWGTLAQWTLWNGFLSYLLMGALFIGEYIVRKIILP